MKSLTKILIELDDNEYETLIRAQQILKEIADNLDQEALLTDEIERYFDDVDNGIENILNIIENGLETNKK